MKVTMVCDVLGKENNGTTVAAMNLYRSLKAKGHNVKVVCPDADRKGEEDFFVVPTISFGKALDRYIAKNGVAIAKCDEGILTEAIKDADVVHVMVPFGLGRKSIKIAEELGIPVTAGFHAQAENLSSHVFLKDWKFAQKLIYKNFYKHFYNKVSAVHYPTKFIQDVFENAVKKQTNAYVISNGVNKRFIRKKVCKPIELQDKYVITFTGRYSKEKSHKVLIDAVSKSKYKSKIQLVFAGCGPLENKLRKYSMRKLPIQPIFKFFDRDAMVKTLNYSDLYVHPAEIEIEAIACLEAIACGVVPVIANSKRCATKAFAMDEKNLFKNNSSKDLKEKIDYWLDNPEEKKKRSEEYLGYASKFDQDICMDRMEEMLKDVINLKNDAI